MSPELLDPDRFGVPKSEENKPTRQSDCYALGMVIYEVGVHVNEFAIAKTYPVISLGFVRTPPLPRDPVGYSSRPCDHGRSSTEETGGGETARIQ